MQARVRACAGDEATLEYVAHSLDPNRDGASVPSLVVGDSGGAAQDIYDYVIGAEGAWGAPAEKRPLPSIDGEARDEAYVKRAAELLPRILELGQQTGQNSTRQLDFFTMSADLEFRNDLAMAMQKAMMNDCPNVNEELLLAVKWGQVCRWGLKTALLIVKSNPALRPLIVKAIPL